MRILIFLTLVFVIYYVLRNVSNLAKTRWHSATRSQRGGDSNIQIVDELVKDPVCGVYVARKQAVKCHLHGKTIYFCSNTCKEKYVNKSKNL